MSRRRYWFVRAGIFALRYGFVPLRQRLAENRERKPRPAP